MLSITKIFHFEAGHALSDHKGLCRNIHGHSYKLHITITGKKNMHDVLMDFKTLKKLVWDTVLKDLDHALLLKKNDINTFAAHNMVSKIFWMEEEPTAESMVGFIGASIKKVLPANISLTSVRLYETESCYAEMNYLKE